jgi:ABC-type transporter Mla subunit MlaD
MNAEDKLAMRVGAAMLIGIALAITFVLIVDDIGLRRRVGVRVQMSHNGGLKEGADVQIAGRIVGEIHSIELANRGGVILHTRVEKRYAHMAPVNGEWFVNSKGIFAERYLEIGPPAGEAPWDRTIEDGDEVRGVDAARLDRITAISMGNFNKMRALLDEVEPELDQLRAALDETSRLLDEIQPGPGRFAQVYATQVALVDEVGATTEFWRNTGVKTDDAKALADGSRNVMTRARGQVAALRTRIELLQSELNRIGDRLDPERFAQFERAYDEGRDALDKLEAGLAVTEEIANLVETGQGTIGGFLHDHELRDFAKRLQRIIKRQGWEVVGHPSNRDLR